MFRDFNFKIVPNNGTPSFNTIIQIVYFALIKRLKDVLMFFISEQLCYMHDETF